MKKIISVILTLTILLSMSSFTIFASSGALTIATPAHGATIENVRTEIKLSNSAADSEFTYEFDGKTLNDATLTQDMLTIGEHTLVVYEEAIDGTIRDAKSTFYVKKQLHDTTEINFNNLDNQINSTDSTVYLYPYPKNTSAATQVSVVRKSAVISLSDGREKTSEKADVAVMVKNSGAFTASGKAASFNVTFPAITTIAVFEQDIKLSNSNAYIWYEMNCSQTYGAAHKYFYVGGPAADSHHIENNGNFFGDSKYPYAAGKWYYMKTIINFMSQTVEVYIKDYDTGVTTKVFEGPVLDDAGKKNVVKDITSVKLQCRSSKATEIFIDNVKISESPAFTGIKNIEYMYDTELNSDANPDSSRLTGLKINMNEPVIAAVPVTVTDKSGNAISISETTMDAASNAIIATLPSGHKLTANTEYKVSVSLAANLAGLSDLATKSFKTKADSYAAEEPQFKVGTTKLIKKTQLCGNVLTVDVPIVNADTPKPAAFVLAVRDGNKLVGLDILIPDGGVPVGGDTYTLQTGTLPSDMTDVTIQIMYLNDINNISTAFATVTKTLN